MVVESSKTVGAIILPTGAALGVIGGAAMILQAIAASVGLSTTRLAAWGADRKLGDSDGCGRIHGGKGKQVVGTSRRWILEMEFVT